MNSIATSQSRSAEIDAIRTEDPESWAHISAMLDGMPSFVRQADEAGDLPDGLLSLADARVLNRMNLPARYGGLGLAMPPVLSLGTEAQRQSIFGRYTDSDTPRFGAFAITEPQSGSDAVSMRTTARKTENGSYILNGEKCFITNGQRANDIVVFASIAPEKGRFGIRAFHVERGTPGFSVDRVENMMGLRTSQLASLCFTDCEVPALSMLGHTGKRGPFIDAFAGAQSAWDYMRPALASGINGASLGAIAQAERVLEADSGGFVKADTDSIIKSLLVHRERIEGSRLIAMSAARTFDAGKKASFDASVAKAYASKIAIGLAEMLTQAFPVLCARKGHPLEKFVRDAKAFDILEGTGDMQRLMITNAYTPAHFTHH